MSSVETLRDFGKKLVEYLSGIAEDITTLTVVTSTGKSLQKPKESNPEEKIFVIEETGVSAVTIIELDGDIIFRIPVQKEDGSKLEIDEKILKLHEENVKLAMDNWKTFITTLVDISTKLLGLLG